MEGRVSILVSILLAFLELGLLLGLDVGNGEDQANAAIHDQSINGCKQRYGHTHSSLPNLRVSVTSSNPGLSSICMQRSS